LIARIEIVGAKYSTTNCGEYRLRRSVDDATAGGAETVTPETSQREGH
jgi:hypothetical protein